nr:sodium:solute symporter family protein [uncultured Draconibacterium sp.]
MSDKTIVLLVCFAYFFIIIIAGIIMMSRNKKASDFLVAGRKLSLPLTIGTLTAVQIGAGIILGGSETGNQMGIWPGMWYALGCGGGLIVAGLLVAAKLKKKDSFVPLDFYEARYGKNKWVRIWAWMSNVPSLLGIFIAQLLACGSLLSGFGIPFYQGIIICAAIILIYSTLSGMWGVVLTDAIQSSVILIGIPVVAIASLILLNKQGISMAEVYHQPFIPKGTFTKFIYLVVPFLIAISVSYDAYLRFQSAKDAKTARNGAVIAGVLVIFIGILSSTVGVAGHLLYPEIKEGVFSHMVITALPPVLAGITIAAVLGAAMSSGAGLLMALGATFSRDLFNCFIFRQYQLDEMPHSKLISRLAVGLSVIAGVLLSFKVSNILDAIIIFNYPYMGSLLIPLLAGVLWKGATKRGAVTAIFTGGIIGVGAFLSGIYPPFSRIISSELGLFIAYSVSLGVLIIVSKLETKKL